MTIFSDPRDGAVMQVWVKQETTLLEVKMNVQFLFLQRNQKLLAAAFQSVNCNNSTLSFPSPPVADDLQNWFPLPKVGSVLEFVVELLLAVARGRETTATSIYSLLSGHRIRVPHSNGQPLAFCNGSEVFRSISFKDYLGNWFRYLF